MKAFRNSFDEDAMLRELKHYLPSQLPFSNCTYRNPLHAFQTRHFHDGLRQASQMLGYKVTLSISEFRGLFNDQQITPDILEKVLLEKKGPIHTAEWRDKVLLKKYTDQPAPRIGSLRANWKTYYRFDPDRRVHPVLFRILYAYLDQGVASSTFPVHGKGLLESIRTLEANSFASFFKTGRARQLLLHTDCSLPGLLKSIVGDEALYAQYLFDQQFAHQGWSGLVSGLEEQPGLLLKPRHISLREFIALELLLEIDALEMHHGKKNWSPLASKLSERPVDLFANVVESEYSEVMAIWQEAYEWSLYDQVLGALRKQKSEPEPPRLPCFQAVFSMEDPGIIRRYLDENVPECKTFITPAYFGGDFYFQPSGSPSYIQSCPGPVTSGHQIEEFPNSPAQNKSTNSDVSSNNPVIASLVKKASACWSVVNDAWKVLQFSAENAPAASSRNPVASSQFLNDNKSHGDFENGLQISFTIDEMADRVESLLRSIGLVKNFAPIVYIIGHVTNHRHDNRYGFDPAGRINAKVFAFMANQDPVRAILRSRKILIPAQTQFLSGFHDAFTGTISFQDETILSPENRDKQRSNEILFLHATGGNVTKTQAAQNEKTSHAGKAFCVIGSPAVTKNPRLRQRAFLNSYDHSTDHQGNHLLSLLETVAPVCGGINLQYYFSRVDMHKLGAGSGLTRHVAGLYKVTESPDGDLRTGLPRRMVEMHDPVRMLFIVEQFPDVILDVIERLQKNADLFINEWVRLIAINPDTREFYILQEGRFQPYKTYGQMVADTIDLDSLYGSRQDNLLFVPPVKDFAIGGVLS